MLQVVSHGHIQQIERPLDLKLLTFGMLPNLCLRIALMLRIRYETLKIGELNTTQINRKLKLLIVVYTFSAPDFLSITGRKH